MALAQETKRVSALFDYTDDDVNKGVQEFLHQMRKSPMSDPLLLMPNT